MSKKKLILTIVALLAAAALALTVLVLTNPRVKDTVLGIFGIEPEVTGQSFTVTVVHSDGTEKEFSYTTEERYLGTFLQQEGLIDGPIETYGMYIQLVDGETAVYEENSAYWAFYENGQYANQGIDQTLITEGTAYSLVYSFG